MSYKGIKDQLIIRLGALGFRESKEGFNFDNATSREYEKTFILFPVSGSLNEESNETLVGQVYDTQSWQIQIAFGKSAHNDVNQRDALSRKISDIIKDLDNPTNWEGVTNGARFQRYDNWELLDTDNYFLLIMNLNIVDVITY